MSEDTRTLKELANEALMVQDACNLSGVVLSWSRAIMRLRTVLGEIQPFDTTTLNEHPINKLWADKVAHLTGTQFEPMSVVSQAYDKVYKLLEE